MIPEREREALMRLTMCARIECDFCKYKDESLDACDERITRNMNILADALKADRKTEPKPCEWCKFYDGENCFSQEPCKVMLYFKTEPSNSEIPNNCDKYRCYKCWWWDYDHGCQTLYKCKYKPLDKDINVRSKTENNSEKPNNCEDAYPCDTCRHNKLEWYSEICDSCCGNNNHYEPKDEPQYEMGMGTLKCDNCSEYGSFKCTKCDGEMYFKRLEPKDEPQTER